MTKKTYIIVAIIVVLAVAGLVWWVNMRKAEAPMPEIATPADTTDVIQQELAGIDVGELDKEFKDVDEALSGL